MKWELWKLRDNVRNLINFQHTDTSIFSFNLIVFSLNFVEKLNICGKSEEGAEGFITMGCHCLLHCFDCVRLEINQLCENLEPWAIVACTVVLTLILLEIKEFIWQDESIFSRIKRCGFRFVRSLPVIKEKIDKEMNKARFSLQEEAYKANEGMPFLLKLPEKGWNNDEILEETEKYTKLGSCDWMNGRVSGAVYNYTDELVELASKVYSKCAWTNPLHHDVFPGTHKMEAEVVRMVCNMFNGGPESCGVLTSGGTESIVLACKAYRDRAHSLGIRQPQIVCSASAHAAFDKAAMLMNAKITHVPFDPITCKVDLKAMRRAITKDTCMLVASAPHFPHGICDPVEEVAKLGLKYKIPVHVDACLGGFLIAFMEKAGFPLPPFDFRVPGVTSISCDTHKYGSAPKGTSVILYKDPSLRHFQYFVSPDWPGGIYASPSLPGSRSGGIIATCWATMLHFGESGYVDNTRKIITTTRKIEEGLKKVRNIYVLGEPLVSVIAIGSHDFDIYRLSDDMTKKGWNLNALQFPSSVHLCVTMMHTANDVADQFLEDVSSCVKEIMKDPKAGKEGKAAIYGLAQSIPDRSMVSELTHSYMDACYSTRDEGDKKTLRGSGLVSKRDSAR